MEMLNPVVIQHTFLDDGVLNLSALMRPQITASGYLRQELLLPSREVCRE